MEGVLLTIYLCVAVVWFVRARDSRRRVPARFPIAVVISLLWPLVIVVRLLLKGNVWYDR